MGRGRGRAHGALASSCVQEWHLLNPSYTYKKVKSSLLTFGHLWFQKPTENVETGAFIYVHSQLCFINFSPFQEVCCTLIYRLGSTCCYTQLFYMGSVVWSRFLASNWSRSGVIMRLWGKQQTCNCRLDVNGTNYNNKNDISNIWQETLVFNP